MYSARMQYSGYTHGFRFHIIRSAIQAYETLREKETNDERPLYRNREWNREERDRSKVDKKRNWYKTGGYESVIFLPTTPASSLVEKCREVVTDSGLAFRLVETAGMSLRKQFSQI